MSRFAPALRRVAQELDLPPAARAAIVLEMAADLESVYEHHRRNGASEEEAIRRAEGMVLGSSEVVRRLSRLHRHSWRGWSERVGARLSGGADVLLLAVGVVPMLLLSAGAAGQALVAGPSRMVWPLLLLGFAITGCIVRAAVRIANGSGGGEGLPVLLLLSATAPAVGLLAFAVGSYSAALDVAAGLHAEPVPIAVLTELGAHAALLLTGLLLGTAGCLAWFILMNRAAVRAARDVTAMLCGEVRPVTPFDGAVLPLVRGRRT